MSADIVQLIASAVTALAAVAGVGIAAKGLQTWREELRGRAKYEVARKILRSVYQVRNSVWFIRSPAIREGETGAAAAPTPAGKDRPPRKIHDLRWQTIAAPLVDLETAMLDGEVLLEADLPKAVDDLRLLLHELGLNLRYLSEGISNPAIQQACEDARWREIGEVAVASGAREKPDAFECRLNAAISRIEIITRRHVGCISACRRETLPSLMATRKEIHR